MDQTEYLRKTGRRDLVTRPMPKPFNQMKHQDFVEYELAKAGDDERAAAEDAAAGLEDCAEYRRGIARLRREEGGRQGGRVPRRPGVRTVADKARAFGEPAVADMRAGRA